MLIGEFIALSEVAVSYDEYEIIEQIYSENEWAEKNVFCDQFKKSFNRIFDEFEKNLTDTLKNRLKNNYGRCNNHIRYLIIEKTIEEIREIFLEVFKYCK